MIEGQAVHHASLDRSQHWGSHVDAVTHFSNGVERVGQGPDRNRHVATIDVLGQVERLRLIRQIRIEKKPLRLQSLYGFEERV